MGGGSAQLDEAPAVGLGRLDQPMARLVAGRGVGQKLVDTVAPVGGQRAAPRYCPPTQRLAAGYSDSLRVDGTYPRRRTDREPSPHPAGGDLYQLRSPDGRNTPSLQRCVGA